MYTGKLVFAQLMEHLPLHSFRRIVTRYKGEHKVKPFSCLDQFLCTSTLYQGNQWQPARYAVPAVHRQLKKMTFITFKDRSASLLATDL